MGITETWLRADGSDVISGELCPNGYRFVHLPRSSSIGGGVGILFKSSFCTKTRISDHSFNSFECLDMSFVGHKSLRVIVIYRPPDCTTSTLFVEEFSSLLEEITLCHQELLIWGDFNIHIDDSSNGMGNQFIDLLSLFNLTQHVSFPMHKHGHILDLIITTNNTEAFDVNNVSILDQFCASDHKAVCFNANLRKPANQRKTISSRRLKNFDFKSFDEIIKGSDLFKENNSLSALTIMYDEILRDAMDKLAPMKSWTIVLRPDAPWYNEDITKQKRIRRRLERKWRSSKLESDKENYLRQCSVVNSMLCKAKENYYTTITKDNAKDSKLLFCTVDKLLQKNNDKYYPPAKNDEELANSFADFISTKINNIRSGFINSHLEQYIVPGRTCPSSFSEFQAVTEKDVMDLVARSKIKACSLDPSPATIMKEYYCELVPVFKTIINLSLSTGVMPDDQKTALLKPLLKMPNADFEQFSSFRPLSNLKFLSKLIEKSACLQLNKYLVNNSLHEPLQSAYKVGHSTEMALLAITDDILLSLDRGENVFLVLLDLSAAFDTVNHSRLLSRLQDTFGIQGTFKVQF